MPGKAVKDLMSSMKYFCICFSIDFLELRLLYAPEELLKALLVFSKD